MEWGGGLDSVTELNDFLVSMFPFQTQVNSVKRRAKGTCTLDFLTRSFLLVWPSMVRFFPTTLNDSRTREKITLAQVVADPDSKSAIKLAGQG